MKYSAVFLVAILCILFPVASHAGVIDVPLSVAGFRSFDALGDPSNDVGNVSLGTGFDSYHVIGIGWNVNITALGANNFLDDVSIRFNEGNYVVQPGAGIFNNGGNVSMNFSSGGNIDLVGLGKDWSQVSGTLNFEFFESVDDFANQIDATWDSGSFTLRVDQISAIPEPSSFVLMGVGAMGLTAWRYLRKRRFLIAK